MIRQRVRIRFRKEGDLRLISHRDLVRVWERLFRRAGVQLSMSEGFHPKARMTFPSALGLGIAGLNEVMEVELAELADADELLQRFRALAPAGLEILNLRLLETGEKKARIARFDYTIEVPPTRRDNVRLAIESLMSKTTHLIEREGRREPLDLRAGVERIALHDELLMFQLPAGATGRSVSVRPREVLTALDLGDLETQGFFLSRTNVELAS
ncbi:MAG: TIGR03936 family radical SAM-associated protein [Pirellulaceae bacterium]|jgi:radical SAM-linked protein|nr:TIGR03936 family radical SAM-associated protein [Pirellulaceae bacterium]MDP7018852.1 TIGR03936 family radical SAM-associated protein [Pirellulaceae bacterium]